MSITRLMRVDDAEALAELLTVNREFLAPWNPIQPEGYFHPGRAATRDRGGAR